MKQVFTFGFGHPFEKHYIVVWALDANRCRELMVKFFGNKWAFQYDDGVEAGVDKYHLTELPMITETDHG